ncbi:MAG: hypothetical protein ACXVQR_05020, partial [Solirubrobacteraceae bacterium]
MIVSPSATTTPPPAAKSAAWRNASPSPGLARVEHPDPAPWVGRRLGAERLLELGVGVEVILDRSLAPAGDKQHALDARPGELLDHVLHDRLVEYRKHL